MMIESLRLNHAENVTKFLGEENAASPRLEKVFSTLQSMVRAWE